jgi:hypothetical protein
MQRSLFQTTVVCNSQGLFYYEYFKRVMERRKKNRFQWCSSNEEALRNGSIQTFFGAAIEANCYCRNSAECISWLSTGISSVVQAFFGFGNLLGEAARNWMAGWSLLQVKIHRDLTLLEGGRSSTSNEDYLYSSKSSFCQFFLLLKYFCAQDLRSSRGKDIGHGNLPRKSQYE